MSVPILRPGDTDDAVPRMKRVLVRELLKLGLRPVAEPVDIDSKTYGAAAVTAVEKFQARKHLQVDGIVGKDTWRALGIDEPVVEEAGRVIIAPNANKPGEPISPMTLKYVERMAAFLQRPLTITTGTNHNKLTVNGKVSEHSTGHAVDLGMAANGGTIDGPVGDRIMEAALVLAGVPAATARAEAQAGGLFNNTRDNQRIQCIWKTNVGGNHHDHVHVGVRPA
jgi:peptidoglycan hydrolase-like protein with peptidoglycan-binding domain